MTSLTLATLYEPTERCQLPIWEDSKIPKVPTFDTSKKYETLDYPNLDNLLNTLDSTNLAILRTIAEESGVTARKIGQSVHLSSKATLERARKLVNMGLAMCQVIPSRGQIQPTNLFFPAPVLTLEVIENAIAFHPSHNPQGQTMQSQNGNSPSLPSPLESLDVIDLLSLRLIGRRIAYTALMLRFRLEITPSPLRNRLTKLQTLGLITYEKNYPHEHRPKVVEHHFLLTSLVTVEEIQQAIAQINPANLPRIISLKVFQENSGLDQVSDSNTSKPPPSNSSTSSAPEQNQTVEAEEDGIPTQSRVTETVQLLRAMAEKIREYEDRISKLEASEQSRLINKETAEILAMLPPTKSKR
jgi:DNA-binding Lrp family transcriptional regulator